MPNEILQNYPLAPIVRREFLKKASAAALLWSATPRTAFAQAAGPESLLIRGGLIVTAERQFFFCRTFARAEARSLRSAPAFRRFVTTPCEKVGLERLPESAH